MKKRFYLILSAFCCAWGLMAQLSVQQLRLENSIDPIGVGETQPRFGWQLMATQRNTEQTAYEVQVAESVAALASGKKLQWSSGKVVSAASIWVPYGGPALQSGRRYYWKVRIWDNHGNASPWSATATWQMGLLSASDWKAKWIAPSAPESPDRPSPLLRKTFSLGKKIAHATAYVTAHGLYEAQLNGKRVGDAYLTPGWTVYGKRLQYQAYDVTNLLQPGANAVGVALGSGWYRGNLGWSTRYNVYGKDIALLFQLDITYADGSTETVSSDASWRTATGSILFSEIYHGETVDARLEPKGWTTAAFDDRAWANAAVQDFPMGNLIATYNEPIRKHETFVPKRIFKTPKGELVVDFGQNLVGWCILKVRGQAGTQVVLRHFEVLDKAGNVYMDNMRAAKVTDTYILSGQGEETHEPKFTFYGFQFVEVQGYPGNLRPEDIQAVALYSDMRPTGQFHCSEPLLNQLQHNIQWGQNGNFLDVPTDCPQRDERLGWTGDAQAFSRTAMFNRDAYAFFAKWLQDLAADQLPNGSVPFVIPAAIGQSGAATGWADAATIIPWNHYLSYGDKRVLERQYASMKAWVGYMERQSRNDLWNTGFHFGDWLFYSPAPDDRDGRAAVTDKYLLAQCFFAHSTQLMIQTAQVLGKPDEVRYYQNLLGRVKTAFQREYVTANGRLVSNTQTAYVLALHFDMLPENQRPAAVQRLVDNIRSYDYHLTTGFLGTPYLCHVLSRFGQHRVAYKLLHQKTYPSWLYPVTRGATTIWERWDGIKPDSSFQTATMNSFNHYAYGAIGDWMYRTVAGLDADPAIEGYRRLQIRPHPAHSDLTEAAASLETLYGKVSSAWKIAGNDFVLSVEIPANSKATVSVPADRADAVQLDGKAVENARFEEGHLLIELGSGAYLFRSLGWYKPKPTVVLSDYVGIFKVSGHVFETVEVKERRGRLYLNIGYSDNEIEATGGSDRFEGSESTMVQFVRDAQGKVTQINVETMGGRLVGDKGK